MKTFDEIHEEGTKKYGWLWLKANQVAVQIAEFYKLDVSEEPLKTALSAICLGLLNRVVSPYMVTMFRNLKDAWWKSWNVLYGALPEPKDPKIAKFASDQFETWNKDQVMWEGLKWKGDDKPKKEERYNGRSS